MDPIWKNRLKIGGVGAAGVGLGVGATLLANHFGVDHHDVAQATSGHASNVQSQVASAGLSNILKHKVEVPQNDHQSTTQTTSNTQPQPPVNSGLSNVLKHKADISQTSHQQITSNPSVFNGDHLKNTNNVPNSTDVNATNNVDANTTNKVDANVTNKADVNATNNVDVNATNKADVNATTPEHQTLIQKFEHVNQQIQNDKTQLQQIQFQIQKDQQLIQSILDGKVQGGNYNDILQRLSQLKTKEQQLQNEINNLNGQKMYLDAQIMDQSGLAHEKFVTGLKTAGKVTAGVIGSGLALGAGAAGYNALKNNGGLASKRFQLHKRLNDLKRTRPRPSSYSSGGLWS